MPYRKLIAPTEAERADFVEPGERMLRSLQESNRNPAVASGHELIARVVGQVASAHPGVMAPRMVDAVMGLRNPQCDAGLGRIIARVQAAAQRTGIPPFPGLAWGTHHGSQLNAMSSDLWKSSALIGVSNGALIGAHLFAKAAVPLVTCRTAKGVVFGAAPNPVDREEGLIRFRELLAAMAYARTPTAAPRYWPSPAWPFWSAASDVRDAIEFFTVAHEYAHLLVGHQVIKAVPTDGSYPMSPKEEESLCDVVALHLATADTANAGPPPVRLLAPMMFMWTIHLLQDAGLSSRDAEHPSARERVMHMKLVFAHLVEQGRLTSRAEATLLETASTIEQLLEGAWQDVRGDLGDVALSPASTADTFEHLFVDLANWMVPPPRRKKRR